MNGFASRLRLTRVLLDLDITPVGPPKWPLSSDVLMAIDQDSGGPAPWVFRNNCWYRWGSQLSASMIIRNKNDRVGLSAKLSSHSNHMFCNIPPGKITNGTVYAVRTRCTNANAIKTKLYFVPDARGQRLAANCHSEFPPHFISLSTCYLFFILQWPYGLVVWMDASRLFRVIQRV